MLSLLNKWSGKLKTLSGTFYLLIFLISTPLIIYGGNWSVLGYGTMVQGRYIYDTAYPSYYLNGGLRYQDNKWSVTASIPFILTDSPIAADSQEAQTDGTHHTEGGIGDFYLFAAWQLPRLFDPLWLQLNLQVKVPLHSELNLFSTGAADYALGLGGQYAIGYYYLSAEAAYYLLGDSPQINYNNTFRYGLGMGRLLHSFDTSVAIHYRRYTDIVPGIEPPQLLTLSMRHSYQNSSAMSLFLSRGFSESSPDWGLTVGLEWPL